MINSMIINKILPEIKNTGVNIVIKAVCKMLSTITILCPILPTVASFRTLPTGSLALKSSTSNLWKSLKIKKIRSEWFLLCQRSSIKPQDLILILSKITKTVALCILQCRRSKALTQLSKKRKKPRST